MTEERSSVQAERESKKIIQNSEREGGTVYEFSPDATPKEKAAAAKKAMPLGLKINKPPRGEELVTDLDDAGQVPGLPPVDSTATQPKQATTGPVDGAVSQGIFSRKQISKAGWREVGGIDEDDQDLHQDIIAKYLGEKYFGSWWHNAGIIFFACFTCWILGRFGAGFAWIVLILAVCSTYYRSSIKKVRSRVRDDLNREQAKQRLESDTESTEWMNTFLVKFWMIYEPVLSATIVASVDQVLATTTPAFLDSLRLSKFTLGTKPPRVEHVKTYPKSEDDIILMDWKFSFTPNDTADLTARQLKNKVNPKVILAIRIGKGVVSTEAPILVEDMAFSGLMRIKLKLMTEFPHIKTVDLSFLEKPNFEYVLKPIGGETFGFDIGSVPGLSNFIREQVHANLGPMMYAPNVFTLNIEQMLSGAGIDTAIGVLQVTVSNATGLKNPDKFSGTPDPYIKFSINSTKELARTQTKFETANPHWDETKFILINSLNDTLTLEVFDFNDYRKDKHLGTANFDLKTLEDDPEQESITSPVILNSKNRGELVFETKFFPVLTPKKLDDGTEEPLPETTTGIVRFTVNQAKDLDSKKSIVGALNPYAVLLLNGKEVYISKKMKRTLAPVWDESTEFLVVNRNNCRLGVMIKDDRDIAVDPIIGSYQIRLNDFLERMEKQADWFNLANASSGRIRMQASWKPVAMTGGLQGSSGYTTPIGVARFHFRQAKDVKNVEAMTGGKSDPFVRITISNIEKARTVHVNNDLNPIWDEILYLPLHHTKEVFWLEVMDHQSNGRHRSLGYTKVAAASLVKQDKDGEYMEYAENEIRVEPLHNIKDANDLKGQISYSVSFHPCINVVDPEEDEEEKESKISEMKVDGVVPNGVQEERTPNEVDALNNEEIPAQAGMNAQSEKQVMVNGINAGHRTTDSRGSMMSENKEPRKIRLSPEELFTYGSGIVVFNIIEGELAQKDAYLEVLFDDFAFPAYSSSKARSAHATWDEMGDGFVRELDFSRMTLRLKSKGSEIQSDSDVLASLSGNTLDVLKNAFNNPQVLTLKSRDGRISKVKVSLKYLPVKIQLDPSESINNMGQLRVDVVEGKHLPAADRSGYSDPYCVFVYNGERVFKTKTVKKTLNPVYGESFETGIQSRTAADFSVEVFDWDVGGSPDFLGKGQINLADLEPFQLTTINVPLDGKSGELKLKLLFRPDYITRTRRGTSTFGGGTGRAVTGVAGAPVKVVGGGMKGVGKGVGGAASFVTGGFRRKSKNVPQETISDDRGIAETAVATGGGVKGTADGTQLAVMGNDKETPLNGDPDQVDADGIATTPSRKSSAHTRNMSISSSRGNGDWGMAQVGIVDGRSFPSGKDIRVVVKTPKKELFKSKAVKGSEPMWNEDFHFSAPLSQVITVTALDHHTFGTDKELGEASFVLEDHHTGDFWLQLSGGANVRLKINFKQQDSTPDKRSISPFARRNK